MRILTFVLGTAVLAGILAFGGCTNDIEKPLQVDRIDGAPEIPRNLQTVVGDAQVTLNWTVSDESKILRYLIYRGDTTRTLPLLIDSTLTMSYTDNGLRNGLRYIYQVSAVGTNLLEGKRSQPVSAMPSLFGISIADGAKYVNKRQVTISLSAANGTQLVMLAKDSLFSGANWSTFAATKTWELTSGDGVKSVYARFRDGEGNETSRFAMDDIVLDTRAAIVSITENSAGGILTAGSVVHFILDAGEADGVATVEVQSVGTINLFEGDPVATPGVYEAGYTIPAGIDVINATITGNFTDAAGNLAQSRLAGTVLNIANPPAASLVTAYPISESEIEIDWTRSNATDFAAYQIFRDTLDAVGLSSTLMQAQANASTTTFRDTDCKPSKGYSYAVYTVDKTGLKSRSNVARVTTLANAAPKAVSIYVSRQDSTSIAIGWTKNDDSDFESYRLYRADTLSADTADARLAGVVAAQATLQFTDSNIHKGEKFDYFVIVYDKYGAASAISNKVRGPRP